MTTYRVKWIIDIDADSPEQAARIAHEIQQDPDSTATVFSVRERGMKVEIDVAKEET